MTLAIPCSIADPEEDRVWTRFLDRSRFDSYQIATYSRIGRMDEAQSIAESVIASMSQQDQARKRVVIIFEDIARAHIALGAMSEAANFAKTGLAALRKIGFTMWLPKYEAIAEALRPYGRQQAVNSYLEDVIATKRQFASRR